MTDMKAAVANAQAEYLKRQTEGLREIRDALARLIGLGVTEAHVQDELADYDQMTPEERSTSSGEADAHRTWIKALAPILNSVRQALEEDDEF